MTIEPPAAQLVHELGTLPKHGAEYVWAIDPGPERSGVVLLEVAGAMRIAVRGTVADAELLPMLELAAKRGRASTVALERIDSYGMPVGAEVFATIFYSGRIADRLTRYGVKIALVPRRVVKLHLCGSVAAKDQNIRSALIDRFGSSKAAAIGGKRSPGPLYGVTGDAWAALAVGVALADGAPAAWLPW